MKIGPVAKGFLTFIPGVQKVLPQKGTGGTNSAYYCYGVWLKHLTLLWENGLGTVPDTLAELGPGDSIGVGLAAMLSGVNNYYALDVVRYSNIETNLQIFDELVSLFESRAARPTKGWPDFDEYLDDTLFPSHILNNDLLEKTLNKSRIAAIRTAIIKSDHENTNDEIIIRYMIPWADENIIKKNTVDVVLSHSVLEHVVDLEKTYQAFYHWLKPGGFMSHQIDFKSHGLSDVWNGYRAYPECLWKVIIGRRLFLINRQPHSVHINFIKNNRFKIICNLAGHRTDGIQRSSLSDSWKDISDSDLTCAGAFIQAIKK